MIEDKVRELERKIAAKMGFEACMPVSGQTYSRKVDNFVLQVLSGIAQSASKMGVDLRLMAHMKEFDEPFESGQVGSSAMAYKRNPMRSERIASLSRYVINRTCAIPPITAAQPVARADAGRLRQPPHHASRRLSWLPTASCRCAINVITRADRVPRKLSAKHLRGGAAVYRDREHPHGLRQGKAAATGRTLHEASSGSIRQQAAKAVKAERQGNNDLLALLLADATLRSDRGRALAARLDVAQVRGLRAAAGDAVPGRRCAAGSYVNAELVGAEVEINA